MIGQTLSRYKITGMLGEGGMGVVYRAEDPELGREVALKLLPAEMADNPERLERFRREAKAVAAINHPNIVTIHSIESIETTHFLTMELVEGESLDRIIPPGGMPLAKVFEIAVPLADALASAHESGIVHRDLKPANVMITGENRIKVLDFGLAKLVEDPDSETGDPALTAIPTELTAVGMVMGTAPYMSPEQVEGRTMDHRTDIFSLGIVLYEMATGKRPFVGDTAAALVSSILRDEPPTVTEINESLPRHLARIIQHCLEKDPEARYQSAKDVRNELKSLRARGRLGFGDHGQRGRPHIRATVYWYAAIRVVGCRGVHRDRHPCRRLVVGGWRRQGVCCRGREIRWFQRGCRIRSPKRHAVGGRAAIREYECRPRQRVLRRRSDRRADQRPRQRRGSSHPGADLGLRAQGDRTSTFRRSGSASGSTISSRAACARRRSAPDQRPADQGVRRFQPVVGDL